MTESYAPLVDVKSLEDTSVFLDKQGLFYNGAITERTNIREFITDGAHDQSCDLIFSNDDHHYIIQGKYRKRNTQEEEGECRFKEAEEGSGCQD